MRDREKERNIRLPESYVQQGGPVRPPRPSRARRAAPRPGPEPSRPQLPNPGLGADRRSAGDGAKRRKGLPFQDGSPRWFQSFQDGPTH
mgnify:CR=1 FL=1